MSSEDNCNEEKDFVEFRRKVREAEVLSAAMERLLKSVNFSGRISVVVQNGRVLKSGYEEGFFRQREPARCWSAAWRSNHKQLPAIGLSLFCVMQDLVSPVIRATVRRKVSSTIK